MPAAADAVDCRRWVASGYRFFAVQEREALRRNIEQACVERGLTGTVLIATEGVNAALSGSREALRSFFDTFLPASKPNFSAVPDIPPFRYLKVRIKDEVIAFGRPLGPAAPVGRHVDPQEWNALLEDPEVLVLDARNAYESDLGSFRNAERADIATFRDFPEYVRRALDARQCRRIALYCTGGIRCEKASAHLLEEGFADVYQLDGGILRYLAETTPEENAFEGDCFVFDQRLAVAARR